MTNISNFLMWNIFVPEIYSQVEIVLARFVINSFNFIRIVLVNSNVSIKEMIEIIRVEEVTEFL